MIFNSIGIARHRIGSDGCGVTTLVGGCGCPLDCRYCLNPQCKLPPWRSFTISELFEYLDPDSLYFSATGGGICFGGGEPLLQTEFIRDFILFAKERGRDWKFTLETSLAVPVKKLSHLDGLIDRYIVDIKDMNREIYESYTKKSPDEMLMGLDHLSAFKEKLTIKVPLIGGYNNRDSVTTSCRTLERMGFRNITVFKYTTNVKKG